MSLAPRFTLMLPGLARQWRRAVDEQLMRYGISEAIALPLVHISRGGGGMTQAELAASLGIGGPALVRLLDRLVTTGLVARQGDSRDKRVKRLFLTDKGTELVAEIERVIDELRDKVLAAVSADELDMAYSVCTRMADALKTLDDNRP